MLKTVVFSHFFANGLTLYKCTGDGVKDKYQDFGILYLDYI